MPDSAIRTSNEIRALNMADAVANPPPEVAPDADLSPFDETHTAWRAPDAGHLVRNR
jgi:hypothetical protein